MTSANDDVSDAKLRRHAGDLSIGCNGLGYWVRFRDRVRDMVRVWVSISVMFTIITVLCAVTCSN